MAKAKTIPKPVPPEDLLKGEVIVDCDFRPDVPADALVHLSAIKTTIELIPTYEVKSAEDKLDVFKIVQLAADRIRAIEKGYEDKKAVPFKAHRTICAHENEDKADWLTIRQFGLAAIEVWDREQDRIKRENDARIEREQAAARRAADEEAARIQREADEAAAKLRREGEMSQARQVEAAAAEKAQVVVEQATAIADVGVITAPAQRIGGLGEARPWIAVVDDARKVAEAVAKGIVPLTWIIPKRGGGEEEVPLLIVNPAVITLLAKRLQKEDIGIPGCHGERDFGYRVSAKDSPSTPAAAPIKSDTSEGSVW